LYYHRRRYKKIKKLRKKKSLSLVEFRVQLANKKLVEMCKKKIVKNRLAKRLLKKYLGNVFKHLLRKKVLKQHRRKIFKNFGKLLKKHRRKIFKNFGVSY
jgi:hypothetical protein